ncbi:alpha/beta hydrolase-fold protein [Fontibacter flavus]|uniref:Alpha/beta hydrolase-fold protein n=1 Tax=Fontibacter flavus TaxID=654838 RepID=A0ABV6FS20_9BACT
MRYFGFLIILIGFVSPIQGQNHKTLFYQGQEDSLYSEILGENRPLLIYLPQSTRGLTMAETPSPVVYMLDGNSQFSLTSQILKQLGYDAIPPSIVVAIVNTDRTRDLTPTAIDSDPTGFDVSRSGGGESFLDFIEKELIPYIDQKYKTTPYRTFIGHSLGGLLAGYTFATRPNLFNNVISLDPTTTWDDALLVKKLKAAAEQGKLAGKGFVFAVADADPTGNPKVDPLLTTFRIPNEQVRDLLSKRTDLSFLYKNYPIGTHQDMVIPGIYDWMKFLFSWYADLQLEIFDAADPILGSSKTTEELIKSLESIYQRMSAHFGYPVKPQEDMINSLGYWALQTGDLERAKMLFEMNIKNYPESANAYDSMGDFYMASDQKEDAIRFFKEALKRYDNAGTRKKLEELENSSQD